MGNFSIFWAVKRAASEWGEGFGGGSVRLFRVIERGLEGERGFGQGVIGELI